MENSLLKMGRFVIYLLSVIKEREDMLKTTGEIIGRKEGEKILIIAFYPAIKSVTTSLYKFESGLSLLKSGHFMRHNVVIGLLLVLSVWAAPFNAPAAETNAPLTLERAIEIALKQNPDVAEAESRMAEAEARLQAAQAAGRLTIKVRGTYDYWSEDQRLLAATRNGEPGVFGDQILGAELVATLPLYTGGRVTAEIEVADWTRRAAAEQSVRVRESLVYQVIAHFYALLAQEEVLRSLETALRAMEEQELTVQSLVAAEKATRVDLLRINVRRAELYERQIRERSIRTALQYAWAALLGLEEAAPPVPQGKLEIGEPSLCPDSTTCLARAFARRADYRAARAAVAAAEAAVRAARAGNRPSLSAQASYGLRWMPDPSDQPDALDRQADFGRIGLVLEFPLFDGRLTAARVAEQEARLWSARERLRRLELQIRSEVESALADIAAARERVRTTEKSIGQAEESFRIVKEKYELAKATMTDVLDAQAALVAAQTSRARALADLAVADARRRLAIGEILP
jgi:outer membrane protein TolC